MENNFFLDILAAITACYLIYSVFKWCAQSTAERHRHKEKMLELDSSNFFHHEAELNMEKLKLVQAQNDKLERELRETRTLLQLAYEARMPYHAESSPVIEPVLGPHRDQWRWPDQWPD